MDGACIFSYITIIGTVSISEDGEGRITGVYLPSSNLPAMDCAETDALAEAGAQVNDFLCGKRKGFDVDYVLDCTEYRRSVLEAVSEIPYGEVRTYKDVAERTGSPNSYRAAGTACASNPLPLIIPCHRVVPSTGGIGSYGGGSTLKRRLLEIERRFM